MTAMKEKDELKLSVLRMLKSAIQLVQTEKSKDAQLSDEDVFAIIRRSIKQRKEAAEAVEAKLRQQLQAAMGSATSAVFQGGGKISWKKSKDRLAPDLERLSLDHPGLLQQYSKPVAGSRRFVVQAGRGRS